MRRISRIIAALGATAIVVGTVVVGAAASPAVAAPEPTLTWTDSSVHAQFGESWGTQVTYTAGAADTYFGGYCRYSGCPASVRLEGPVAFDFEIRFYTSGSGATTSSATIFPMWTSNLPGVLVPGSYTLTVTFQPPTTTTPAVSSPLPVTIVPAELAFTLTTQADPAVPAALIASALLTRENGETYVGVTPGGVWTLKGTNEAGEEVLARDLTFGTDGARLWGSTYWADPPPGEKITLTISATGTAAEYSITDASTTLTTVAAPAPPPTPEPTPPPDEVASASAAALPVWSLLAAGLVFLAAVLTILIVLIRRRRPARVTTDAGNDAELEAAAEEADAGDDVADTSAITVDGSVR